MISKHKLQCNKTNFLNYLEFKLIARHCMFSKLLFEARSNLRDKLEHSAQMPRGEDWRKRRPHILPLLPAEGGQHLGPHLVHGPPVQYQVHIPVLPVHKAVEVLDEDAPNGLHVVDDQHRFTKEVDARKILILELLIVLSSEVV